MIGPEAFVIVDAGGAELTVELNLNGNIDLLDEDGSDAEILVQED